MCVSSELGQKGRFETQWAGDKAAEKSTVLSALCLGVSPRLRTASFLCRCTIFHCHPAWSDLLTEEKPQERYWAPVPGTGLLFQEPNPGTRHCLIHKGILFCGLKAEIRGGKFWTST